MDIMESLVRFGSGDFPKSAELVGLFMAIQGAMAVRKGPNKNRDLNWFHAFSLSLMTAFAGGWLGFLWMAKPSALLASDIGFGSSIIAFVVINYAPMDIGFKMLDSVPGTLITTMFAQLFRSTGMMRFVRVCYEQFKDNPSPYYPIPVFGPILYATLLGCMAGFVFKGFNGFVQNGMPWPVQNGLFCASFYHFYLHDQTGPIGIFLRSMLPAKTLLGVEDGEFAAMFVTYFMQITGILMLPLYLGPGFSPFNSVAAALAGGSKTETDKKAKKD